MKSFDNPNCMAPSNGQRKPANLYTGTISSVHDESIFIDDELIAKRADGQAIDLSVGDLVSYIETTHGVFVLDLLMAVPRDKLTLSYRCADQLIISAENIELVGRQSISFRSLRDITIETCSSVKLHCKNILSAASDSIVSVTSTWVQKCRQGSVEASEVLRTDAGSQIVTAKEDLRLDAKRINMG